MGRCDTSTGGGTCPQPLFYSGGVASPLFGLIAERYGRLDLLFNNAGVFVPNLPLEDLSPQQWRAITGVNLDGAFYCMQEAFRLMKAQSPKGGRIISLSQF